VLVNNITQAYNIEIMSERGTRRREAERRKKASNANLSRREFLKTLGLVAAGTATLTGVGYATYRILEQSSKDDQKIIYNGEVSSLKGQEVIPQSELNEYLEALENSSVPLLQKMGRDIRSLSQANSKPQELPDWVNEESFPMAFTKGPGPESKAVLDILWNNQSPYSFKVNWQEHGVVENPFVYTAWMGTYLGMTPSLKEREPLVKGLILAKEHISHMLMQRLAEDFNQQLRFFRINEITELDGSTITDPSRLKQATVSIFLSQQTNRSTTAWKTTDGLPVLYLAHAYNDLLNNEELPREDGRAVGRFIDAHKILVDDIESNQGEGLILLDNQINLWVDSDTLLPPGNVADAYHPPIRSMIDKWHNTQRQ